MSKKELAEQYKRNIQWSKDDNSFVATVAELPGCATHGATFDEAWDRLDEAILAYLDVLEQDKRELPKPEANPNIVYGNVNLDESYLDTANHILPA